MNKLLIVTLLSILFVPLAGIIPVIGQPVWFSQYVALQLIAFVFCALYFWNFNKFLSVFILICVFSTYNSFLMSFYQCVIKFITNNNTTVTIPSISPRAIILLLQLSLCSLASFQISKLNKRQRKIILLGLFALLLLQTFWLGKQYLGEDRIFSLLRDSSKDGLVGFSGAADQLGSFYAIITPALLYLSPFILLFSGIGIILAKSSFAIVSMVLASLFFLFFKSKLMFIIIIPVLIFFSIIYFTRFDILNKGDFTTRLNVWRYAIKSTIDGKIDVGRELRTNRVTGYGFGNFQAIFPYVPQKDRNFNYIDEKFTHAHNDYVEIFFELGWAGLISVILLSGSVIYEFIKSKKTIEIVAYASSVMAYGLNAVGNFVSQIAVSGLLIILFYGMFKGAIRDGNTAKSG